MIEAHASGAQVTEEHVGAYNCYTAAGFKRCGVYHERSFWASKHRGINYMEILALDYCG